MGINKKKFLKRVVEVQNIVLTCRNKGITQKWIFENVIYPRFLISYSTFNKYLARPAKRELRQLENIN